MLGVTCGWERIDVLIRDSSAPDFLASSAALLVSDSLQSSKRPIMSTVLKAACPTGYEIHSISVLVSA